MATKAKSPRAAGPIWDQEKMNKAAASLTYIVYDPSVKGKRHAQVKLTGAEKMLSVAVRQ